MSPKRKKETHILVVDDQRDIAEFLRTTLESAEQGYAVACVPSGEEALLEIQRKTFALVVVDYRLPGMTGLELIRHIQKRSDTTRFLLVTGYEIEEDEAELDSLGITEILGKPIDLETFTTAVEAAIKGERRPSKAVQEAPIAMLDFDEGLVLDHISALQLDLGSIAVLLADRTGAVRLEKGSVGSRDLGDIMALLAEGFSTSVAVSSWVSDGPPSFVHYYDGSRYDIYTLAVDASYFMIVVYPGNAQTKLGPVLSYGRRTVKKILSALGEQAPAVEEEVEAEELVEEAAEEEMAVEPAAEVAEPEFYEEEVLEAEEGEEGDHLDLEGLEIDLETLEEIDSMFDEEPLEVDQGTLEEIDAMLGSAEAEELNNADAYWDEATREETAAADGTLSREEAIKRGLIPDDLSPPE